MCSAGQVDVKLYCDRISAYLACFRRSPWLTMFVNVPFYCRIDVYFARRYKRGINLCNIIQFSLTINCIS